MRRLQFAAALLALIAGVFTGRAVAWEYCTPLAYAGLGADLITTVGAIESGRGVEANPIYGSGDTVYPLLAAFGVARALAIWQLDRIQIPVAMERDVNGKLQTVYGLRSAARWNCLAASLSLGAAGHNLAIWTGNYDRRLDYAITGALIPPGAKVIEVLNIEFE